MCGGTGACVRCVCVCGGEVGGGCGEDYVFWTPNRLTFIFHMFYEFCQDLPDFKAIPL